MAAGSTSNEVLNIQNQLLNQVRKSDTPVTVFLLNGVQIKGTVESFDNYTIVVNGDSGRQNMIYKHAISTIVPTMPMRIRIP